MKNKIFLVAGIICLFISFVLIVYLLYKHVNEYNVTSFEKDIQLINLNKEEDNSIYYFSIKNTSNKNYKYSVILELNNDFNENELNYKLISKNEIVKEGKLGKDNILDNNVIESNSIKVYSLIITSETDIKPFNYKISIKENNKIHS